MGKRVTMPRSRPRGSAPAGVSDDAVSRKVSARCCYTRMPEHRDVSNGKHMRQER